VFCIHKRIEEGNKVEALIRMAAREKINGLH
jgi:hypothetical protein